MAKLLPRQTSLALLAASAALLLVPGTLPARAQEPPAPPSSREAHIPAAGWLGVSIDEVSAQKAQELKLPGLYGVQVTDVGADSPAAKAGLKNGDVITDYNGQRVEGVIEFRRMVRETPPGRAIKMTVWRDGRSQSLSAEMGKSPNQDAPFEGMLRRFGNLASNFGPNMFGLGAAVPATSVLGITGQDLSGQLGRYFNAPDGGAVLITGVEANSPAAKAGLQAGDVITKLDSSRVRTMRELREQLRENREAKNVTLSVLRKGSELSVNVEPRRGRAPGEAPSIPL